MSEIKHDSGCGCDLASRVSVLRGVEYVHPKDGGSRFPRNVSSYLPVYTASRGSRLKKKSFLKLKPQVPYKR
jgi:hypothetical protein